jgi:hypothetical protein
VHIGLHGKKGWPVTLLFPASDNARPQVQAFLDFGYGPGFGRGMGHGRGSGRGCGPGRGWIAVGYASGGNEAVSAHMRVALEERKAFLREELARTEALLEGSPEKNPDSGNQPK